MAGLDGGDGRVRLQDRAHPRDLVHELGERRQVEVALQQRRARASRTTTSPAITTRRTTSRSTRTARR
jgi:hypothetical protein